MIETKSKPDEFMPCESENCGMKLNKAFYSGPPYFCTNCSGPEIESLQSKITALERTLTATEMCRKNAEHDAQQAFERAEAAEKQAAALAVVVEKMKEELKDTDKVEWWESIFDEACARAHGCEQRDHETGYYPPRFEPWEDFKKAIALPDNSEEVLREHDREKEAEIWIEARNHVKSRSFPGEISYSRNTRNILELDFDKKAEAARARRRENDTNKV